MDKFEELANEIIDEVSEVIENNYPELKPRCITDDESIDSPALINGTIYYNLESDIVDKLKKFKLRMFKKEAIKNGKK